MTEELKIDYKWLGGRRGSAVEVNFYAEIGLAIGNNWLTRLEDLEAKTVRTHVRGCAYQLAMWFAANWWRLRWEPRTRGWVEDTDWRLTHGTAGAGGGYVWPNVLFASDGDSISIASLPQTKAIDFEPVRYLSRVIEHITAAEFEQKVDLFIEGILSRLNSVPVDDKRLPTLWEEVLAERRDSETADRRKLEALAGFDSDDAPDELLEQLLKDRTHLGKSAVEEVAAEARHSVKAVLEPLRMLTKTEHTKSGGFRITMPALSSTPSIAKSPGYPWQRGAALARLAREEWGLGRKPVKNRALGEILNTKPAFFSQRSSAGLSIPVAVRKKTNGDFDVYLDSCNPTTRRFAVCRMIGDYLYFAKPEKLLPATHTKTSRQKLQRAFAQQFLCPIDALLEKIQTAQPDEDDIAEAAAHFHVSPLMVRTTLGNKGEIDREALTWSD